MLKRQSLTKTYAILPLDYLEGRRMELISRESAWQAGLTKFFTGKPCKKGHICERYVSNGGCVFCMNPFSAKRSSFEPNKIQYQPPALWVRPGMSAEHYVGLNAFLQTCANAYMDHLEKTDPLFNFVANSPLQGTHPKQDVPSE